MGYSLVVTTNNYNTFKITVIINVEKVKGKAIPVTGREGL
jgi:hypothetical protein